MEGFQKAMASINNPILGVLIGAGITAVLQSSAASIGILQTLVAQGLIGLDSAIFILFGQNIGTCVTALLACAGTNSTAKRAATVHLLFNVIGTVIFVIIACCLPLASWVEMLSPAISSCKSPLSTFSSTSRRRRCCCPPQAGWRSWRAC